MGSMKKSITVPDNICQKNLEVRIIIQREHTNKDNQKDSI